MEAVNSGRYLRIMDQVLKTFGITHKIMEKKQGLQIDHTAIRQLSDSLKLLRSILREFCCPSTVAAMQAIPTGKALLEIKGVLQQINQWFQRFESTPTNKFQEQVVAFHLRIDEKILQFQNARLNSELAITQGLLLTVGILSPQMPDFVLHSGSNEDQQPQLMNRKTITYTDSENASAALISLTSTVKHGLFVGYYTNNYEPVIGGAMPTHQFFRFDLKVNICEEVGSDISWHFRVEMGQFDNGLKSIALRNYSFVKTFKAGHFPSRDPVDGRRRLSVQKWKWGGEWIGENLDMNCADWLGNFLLEEIDAESVVALDGTWYGFYFVGEESEPSDQPFHLTMHTTRDSEGGLEVRGDGSDQHGMFDISGHLLQDRVQKKLEFRKSYFFYPVDGDGVKVLRFSWDYIGLVEAGGRGVTGIWGRGSIRGGTFAMARVD